MDNKFRIRGYGRTELARMYYGDNLSDRSCLRLFLNDLEQTPGLMAELRALGYDPKKRIYTRQLVKCIVNRLGEP